MKKSKYSDSQIISILNQVKAGATVSDLCREHGMSSATFYKWRAKYGGMDASMMSRLKELEAENLRLKPKKRLVREKPESLSVPTSRNQIWSMDFMHDQLGDQRAYRLFNVIDDYNREAQRMSRKTGFTAYIQKT